MPQTSHEPGGGEPIDWFGLPSPALVRAAVGLAAAAAASMLGALVLGEYEFDGWLPLGAGVLFGLAVAEVAVGVGKRRTVGVAVASAVIAGAGLVGAGLISAGAGEVPSAVWLATAVGAVAAFLRVAPLRRWARLGRRPTPHRSDVPRSVRR